MGAELNGKVVNLTPSDPEFKIPPGLPHRFWPEASSDDMKIQVRVEGGTGDGGFGEKFMRNLVGYLKDSDDQGIAISPFVSFQSALPLKSRTDSLHASK